jgi:hypothetical protein
MRRGRQGWIMPEEDIPSMLQMIEAKIASSEIEVHHRDVLIRLKSLLEEDLEEVTRRATASRVGEERCSQSWLTSTERSSTAPDAP